MSRNVNTGIFHTVTVRDDERAFLYRDGRFERLLGPGRFRTLDFGRHLTARSSRSCAPRSPADKALLFDKTQPDRCRGALRDRAGRRHRGRHRLARRRAEAPRAAEHDARVLEDADQVEVERIDAASRGARRQAPPRQARPARARPLVVHGGGRGARGGPAVHRRQADGAAAGRPARVLGGRPHGQDRQGRHASDAARGDGAGDPDQGSRRHPRDADRVHPGGRPGEGGAGGGRRRQHGLPARAVRDPRGGGDAHAGRDPGGARHHRPRGARRSSPSGRATSASRSARSASRT